MISPDNSADFVRQLADVQRGLYTYILQLLPNYHDADDVLQTTNLVMWSKREQYEPGSNFAAWAAKIAYFEVLNHRKRQMHSRLRFNEMLVEQISREATDDFPQPDAVLQMLRQCMEKLSPADRNLIEMQYAEALAARQIAERVHRSPGAIAQSTHRIRMLLLKCIEEKQSATEGDCR
jgi:RNA polymerase sigma-70 factor, ECF subfamily